MIGLKESFIVINSNLDLSFCWTLPLIRQKVLTFCSRYILCKKLSLPQYLREFESKVKTISWPLVRSLGDINSSKKQSLKFSCHRPFQAISGWCDSMICDSCCAPFIPKYYVVILWWENMWKYSLQKIYSVFKLEARNSIEKVSWPNICCFQVGK